MPQRRGGRRREARAARPERDLSKWVPKTKLGRLVLAGEITTLGDAIQTGLPIREPEIVDILLPETEDEVLDVNMVQRMKIGRDTSELQSQFHLVCRLLLEKKKKKKQRCLLDKKKNTKKKQRKIDLHNV